MKREKLRKRWPLGTLVRLDKRKALEAGLFRSRRRLKRYALGTIVGHCREYEDCVYVKWDHRKAPDICWVGFLKRVRGGDR